MKWFFTAVIFIFPFLGEAQQEPLFSQYKLNHFIVNPAIAGAHGKTNVNLMTRNHWIGFKGAPSTYVISGEWRLLKKKLNIGRNLFGMKKIKKRANGRIGLGGMIYSDYNGALSRTGANFNYAYHIKLNYSQLSFGLAASFFQTKFDRDQLVALDYEPLLDNGGLTPLFGIDMNVGAYYIHRNIFYAGLSTNEIMQTINIRNQELGNYQMLRHYYLNMGYNFFINREYKLEPSVLMRFNEFFESTTDISLKLYFKDEYWGGLAYRITGDVVLMAGVRFSNLSFGYSFDYGLNKLMNYSYGSHELNIGYRFGHSDRRFKWQDRYF